MRAAMMKLMIIDCKFMDWGMYATEFETGNQPCEKKNTN